MGSLLPKLQGAPWAALWADRRPGLTVATAGAALLLSQYVAVRAIGSTLFSSELLAFGVTVLALLGPSLGYAAAARVSERALRGWFGIAIAIELVLPVLPRALAGRLGMCSPGFSSLLPLAAALLVLGGAYAALLPRSLPAEPREIPSSAGLPALYGLELLGAAGALAGIFGTAELSGLGARLFWVGYYALPVLSVWLVLRSRVAVALVGVTAAALFVGLPRIDEAITARYLMRCHGHQRPTVLARVDSPYQRVEVVEERSLRPAEKPERALYLDGVPFYRAGELELFSQILAGVPGAVALPAARRETGRARPPALVVGSGSFASAAVLQRLGYAVTVVELDAAVADAGLRYLAPAQGLRRQELELVIADARTYLERLDKRFSLIVLDVPAPFHVRTALLYTPRFYRQVAAVLQPSGVVAISLCEELEGPLASAIAASAQTVFDRIVVAESASLGLAMAYASVGPLPEGGVLAELSRLDPEGGRVLEPAAVRRGLVTTEPLTERNLISTLALARATWTAPPSVWSVP